MDAIESVKSGGLGELVDKIGCFIRDSEDAGGLL